MMEEKDFDFKKIGKQMPYRIPANFFEKMPDQVMECVQEGGHKRQHRIKWIVSATLAAAAVLLGVVFFSVSGPSAEQLPSDSFLVSADSDYSYPDAMDQYIENMPDEELAEWVELSENDIFIN